MVKLYFFKPHLLKPRFFLSVPVALLSLEIYLGIIVGYFITKFCSGQEPGLPGKIRSFTFNIGSYKLHLHHWLLGCMILISAFSLKFYPFLPQFSYGFLGGVIFQGVSCYPDWYKILSRQKNE